MTRIKEFERSVSNNLNHNRQIKPRRQCFGYFLAGLIDADGHIDKRGYLQINFHNRDLSAACYIKKLIGFGYIYKYKKVNGCRYICSDRKGLEKIYELLVNKLRNPDRLNQFNQNLAKKLHNPTSNSADRISKSNYWLCGFIMGDGSFQIKIRNPHKRFKKHQIEVVIQLELKHAQLLEQIQAMFGGSMGEKREKPIHIAA